MESRSQIWRGLQRSSTLTSPSAEGENGGLALPSDFQKEPNVEASNLVNRRPSRSVHRWELQNETSLHMFFNSFFFFIKTGFTCVLLSSPLQWILINEVVTEPPQLINNCYSSYWVYAMCRVRANNHLINYRDYPSSAFQVKRLKIKAVNWLI